MNTEINKMNTTKVNKKTDNMAILEKLLQHALIEYECGCVCTEIKAMHAYLYMYDDFNDQEDSSEYYFAEVVSDNKFQEIELSDTEKEFLRNRLFEVWNIETQYEQELQADQESDDYYCPEEEFTYQDFINYKFY